MSIVIKKCTVAELENAPNFADLLEEYADELAIEGLPHPSAKLEMYRQLDSVGKIHPIAAFFDDKIVGIINILMVMNPHYGIEISTSESYFVAKDYRKMGVGNKLRIAAEKLSREFKSPGILLSAPTRGALSQVLPCVGYKEVSKTFFKELK